MSSTFQDPQRSPDPWYSMQTDEVLQALDTRLPQGLDEAQARLRLRGSARRRRGQAGPVLAGLVPAGLLFGAAGLAWIAGQRRTALGLLCAAAGLARLNGRPAAEPAPSTQPTVKVRRSGRVRRLPVSGLVRGDLVLLDAGDEAPADIRLMETTNLRVDQSALSGDTRPVDKVPQPMGRPGVPPVEQQNMLYLGARLLEGRAVGLVVARGPETLHNQMVASSAGAAQPGSGLEHETRRQSLWLAAGGLAGALAGAALGRPTASLSASLVAGSAGALNLALAIHQRRSARRLRALGVHPLDPAGLSELSQVDTLLADASLFTQASARVMVMSLSGRASELDGQVQANTLSEPEHALLLGGAVLCNNAIIERPLEWGGAPAASGDPAEAALLQAGAAAGVWKPRLEKLLPRVLEAPYTPQRSRMSTVHVARLTPSLTDSERLLADRFEGQPYLVMTRGDLESVLDVCDRAWVDGRIEELSLERRLAYRSARAQLSQAGLRVSGVAFRPLVTLQPIYKEAWTPYNSLPPEIRRELPRGPRDIAVSTTAAAELERGLVLAGLIGMRTEPAPGAAQALRELEAGGIRVILVTADGPRDGLHTARQLGLTGDGDGALTGADLRALDSAGLEFAAAQVRLYARLAPADWVALVRALQGLGGRVAAAGSGPQHVPALAAAQVGLRIPAGGALALGSVFRENRRFQTARVLRAGRRLQGALLIGSLIAILLGLPVNPGLALAGQLAAAGLLARRQLHL